MSDSELIYELEANPPTAEKFFAALQHVLASFVGIITPTLIIGNFIEGIIFIMIILPRTTRNAD